MDPATLALIGLGGWWLTQRAANAGNSDDADVWIGAGAIVTQSNGIQQLAQAIAVAEGFYVQGTIPQRANNPGDLKLPASLSPLGYDNGHTRFATADEGWQALYRQLQLIASGRSRVYSLDMTIAQMGERYAPPNAAVWASNVARVLGVPVSTRLRAILGA